MEKIELDPVTGELKAINIKFYSLFDQNSLGEIIVGDIRSFQNRWASNGKKYKKNKSAISSLLNPNQTFNSKISLCIYIAS